MQTDFLRELDRWLLALLRQKIFATPDTRDQVPVTATEFAQMISDYVLLQVADAPETCWSACGIDQTSDEAILGATTFGEDLLAAGFIGAVCELARWHGRDGIVFMTEHGVPADDAQEIAAAVEVVCAKLGCRGQALIHRLTPSALDPAHAGTYHQAGGVQPAVAS